MRVIFIASFYYNIEFIIYFNLYYNIYINNNLKNIFYKSLFNYKFYNNC